MLENQTVAMYNQHTFHELLTRYVTENITKPKLSMRTDRVVSDSQDQIEQRHRLQVNVQRGQPGGNLGPRGASQHVTDDHGRQEVVDEASS